MSELIYWICISIGIPSLVLGILAAVADFIESANRKRELEFLPSEELKELFK